MSTGAAAANAATSARAERFDERFLRKLESLAILTRRSRISFGQIRAERRSRRVGAGIEFADHRDYVPGDDLRYLDWNLYGRMQRLLVRLFEEDEDLSIYVLFDASASMGTGTPPKLDLAMQVGAALGYVGLANLDRVSLIPLGASLDDGLPLARGKAHILPWLRFLSGIEAHGRTSLTESMHDFLRRHRGRRRGLVVLISDFYDPAGYREALDLLRYNHFETVVIQISAPEELRPAACMVSRKRSQGRMRALPRASGSPSPRPSASGNTETRSRLARPTYPRAAPTCMARSSLGGVPVPIDALASKST